MYWTVWAVQMENEATGKLQKWQPGSREPLFYWSKGLETVLSPEGVYISLLSHEGEMYKSLLSDYEASQRSLMLENSELKKVLQQMKKDMIHILSPRQASNRGACADDSQEQVFTHFYNGIKMNLNMFIQGLDGPKAWNHCIGGFGQRGGSRWLLQRHSGPVLWARSRAAH